jgi:N-acetylglucosamine malate deacetylase 1
MKNKKILIFSPHTDDETLGCGGTINRLSKDNEIFIVCFSYCGNNGLISEFTNACNELCESPKLTVLDFEVRTFDRQRVLDKMIELKADIDPDVVICPSTFDIHQDHEVICNETIRAFKDRCILGYCHWWNIIGISDLRLTVELDEENIKAKNRAMDKYVSQYGRPYFKDRNWTLANEKLEVIIWKY